MIVDTHCHLDASDFDADRDEIVRQAREYGIGKIIVPSVCPGNFDKVRNCCLRHDICLPAYGIHPLYVDTCHESDLDALSRYLRDQLCNQCPPVAIGEIGLDFYVSVVDVSRQEFFFIEQLRMARELNLPVLLHVRRAVDQVLKYLRRFGIRKGIAHAFNGSIEQAQAYIKQGFKLGFGGSMTYPHATRIRNLARRLPLDTIVLETDAPDIPPAWISKARNTPLELGRIARTLAEIRNMDVSLIKMAVAANTAVVFDRAVD